MGSSPLTQGKRRIILPTGRPVRLIPAHAGKTRPRPSPRPPSTAHPRSRGENCMASARVNFSSGSSPLTREKPCSIMGCPASSGLIPAHAGKTGPGPRSWAERRAHPRSCGENVVCFCAPSAVQGSSPLMREKHTACEVLQGVGRLIPAHAGKTLDREGVGLVSWAHPRSHEENQVRYPRAVWAEGSSPSRGENWWRPVARGLRAGSSPLTRGKHERERRGLLRFGLIPAHAGKTLPVLRFYRADRSDLGKP